METGGKNEVTLEKIDGGEKGKIADNKNVVVTVVSDEECVWAGEGSDLWWAEGEKCDFGQVSFGPDNINAFNFSHFNLKPIKLLIEYDFDFYALNNLWFNQLYTPFKSKNNRLGSYAVAVAIASMRGRAVLVKLWAARIARE